VVLKTITHLDVIQNKYQVVDWYIEPQNDPNKIFSNIKPFQGMNELQDYVDSGVYHLANVPFDVYEVNPEKYKEKEPYIAFGKSYSDLVYESVIKGNVQMITGSYCTNIPSILGGIRRAVGPEKRIGVVWMDAHSDNIIPERTAIEKLRLLGVPLSTLVGQAMKEWREEVGLAPAINGSDVLASDIRCQDEEEKRNLQEAGIHIVEQSKFNCDLIWKKEIEQFAADKDVIFLHVDADILHHDYLPAYEYDVVNGNSLDVVRRNIATVMNTGKILGVSVMCVGFENQDDRARDVNHINGIRLVSSVLSNWKTQPEG
jgi:arginase family enzyme